MQRKKTWGKVDICFARFAHNENRDDDREAVHQMKIVELTAELVIGFVMLFFVVKVAGKKMIHQITPFTFISAIVLGELLGNALYDDHVHIWYIVYSITVWGALLILVEYMSQKWLWFRGIAEGKPTVLIRKTERSIIKR